MPVNLTNLQERTKATAEEVQQAQSGAPELRTAVFTGSLANTGTATLAALDALGGTIHNLKVKVWISGATAGLGITPHRFITSLTNPVTFAEQAVPTLGAIHVLGGAAVEDYSNMAGDVPEGLQAELRMDSNGNDSALTFEVYVSYEQ